jgi:hypothetical protein
MSDFDDNWGSADNYSFEEKERPRPTKKQIEKFCEDTLCKHCYYYKHDGCKLKSSYFYTSEFGDHDLVNIDCFTANIKPEEASDDYS